MKIAFFVPTFPKISETFVIDQITGMMDLGHEVHIYADRMGDGATVNEKCSDYALMDIVKYAPSLPHNLVVRYLKAVLLFVLHFYKNPVLLLRALNFFKYSRPAISLSIFYSVIPFLGKKHEYDFMHCHFGPAGLKCFYLRNIGAIRGPFSTVFHGYDISSRINKADGVDFYRPLFESDCLLMPVSRYWKKRLIELGAVAENIVVHHMGVDIGRFTYKDRSVMSRTAKVIKFITIARLVEKKGVEFAVRSVAQLLGEGVCIEYSIIGDGPLRSKINEIVDKLDVSSSIKILGWMSPVEVIEMLNESHILLAPSITSESGDQEGIPVSIMEAMAMGMPVVSTWHSGIPELVQDGITGVLVEEGDVDALTKMLKKLLATQQSWGRMGQEGRNYVEKNFNIMRLNRQLPNKWENYLSGDHHPTEEQGRSYTTTDEVPV